MKQTDLLSPKTDGVDHLNVYSRARTDEGRVLSPFAPTPFTLHGQSFASLEGFYQSLFFEDEEQRALVAGLCGAEAKSWGKKWQGHPGDLVRLWNGRRVAYQGRDFKAEVTRALRAKVLQNACCVAALLNTERLLLTHYYVMMGRPIWPSDSTGTLERQLMVLREELRTEEALRQAQGQLADFGREDLVARLRVGTEVERLAAARALVFRSDTQVPAVIEALVESLNDPSSLTLAQQALRSLVQFNLGPEVAVPFYQQALKHESMVIRLVAIRQLALLGRHAATAAEELQKAQNDTEKVVRLFATRALQEVGSGARQLTGTAC
jgi:predicted NAD-dependent protein-ADP-ribosyltransferase YbiA (DUF1768 family)